MLIREGVAMHAFNGELFVQATWDTSPSRLFRTQFRMGSQDALVLLSDGIVDADGSNAGWVEELLADSVKLSARELAARLVLEGSARGAPDDMSAVVVYLGKRAQREMQEAGG